MQKVTGGGRKAAVFVVANKASRRRKPFILIWKALDRGGICINDSEGSEGDG